MTKTEAHARVVATREACEAIDTSGRGDAWLAAIKARAPLEDAHKAAVRDWLAIPA